MPMGICTSSKAQRPVKIGYHPGPRVRPYDHMCRVTQEISRVTVVS
jgi:hypothetical protein